MENKLERGDAAIIRDEVLRSNFFVTGSEISDHAFLFAANPVVKANGQEKEQPSPSLSFDGAVRRPGEVGDRQLAGRVQMFLLPDPRAGLQGQAEAGSVVLVLSRGVVPDQGSDQGRVAIILDVRPHPRLSRNGLSSSCCLIATFVLFCAVRCFRHS